jgi:hypothetical protein
MINSRSGYETICFGELFAEVSTQWFARFCCLGLVGILHLAGGVAATQQQQFWQGTWFCVHANKHQSE